MSEIRHDEKHNLALKAYLRSKGIEAVEVWVDSESERKFSGGCETCAFSYVETKYYLYWRCDGDWFQSGSEEFSNMTALMRIAVEFSE